MKAQRELPLTTRAPADSGSIQLRNDGVLQVSQSRVRAWRTCRQQHHYKFVENIKPKRVKRPFQFGKIVHSMVEAYANGDEPFEVLDQIALDKKAMFRAEAEMYGNIIEDIRLIMREYFDYWPENSLVFVRRRGRASEFRFEVELWPGVNFTGIIDTVARARRMRWLVENKTFGKRKPNEDERWRSVQAAVYMRANDMLGWFPGVEGMAWNYILSKPITAPEILKSGEMSTAKRGLTFPRKALEVIKDNNLDPADYAEFLELCKGESGEYFSRIFMPMTRQIVDSVWDDFLISARDIADLGETRNERNIGRHCSWCDYEPLCRAAMQGSDVDFIKEREYVPRDVEEHEAYAEAEE